MLYRLLFFLFYLVLPTAHLLADDNLLGDVFASGIVIDLREPEYCEGVLTTSKGGVITASDMRIQAMDIAYTKKMVDGKAVCRIVAEGELLLEFGDYFFVGERLEYDFQDKSGIIYQGRTFTDPWFFGGDTIALNSDGSYTLSHSFLTTSEDRNPDWKIAAKTINLYPNRDFKGQHFTLQFSNVPVLWLPRLQGNLNAIFDGPIRYSFRWDRQGPRAGLSYEIFSWERWKAFLRADYRLTRGPGIGLETRYRSSDHRQVFHTINYVARDSSLENPHEKVRYRFQGSYANVLMHDQVTINFSYDKLSDKYMATDYKDRNLDLEYSGITQLQVRRQDHYWISNFLTTVRINHFQTTKQQLPAFELSFRPFEIASTGVISDSNFNASYLDFKYAKNLKHVHDYCSSRIAYHHRLYRPIAVGPLTITPQAGGLLVYYGNVPKENHRWLTLGFAGCEANLPFSRFYQKIKHVVVPYVSYQSYTYPTSTPPDHFIFDIDDGWYRLNIIRFGVRNNFYFKDNQGLTERQLQADFYANGFINSHTIGRAIPKLYADVTLFATSRLKYTLNTSWDIEHSLWNYCNFRTAWTLSDNFALSAEFRYRNKYDWRKADRSNFMLDAFRSEQELLHSQLSDRRDTLLLHVFFRLNPKWALEFQTRHGWQRKHEPNYTEFELDLIGVVYSAWNIKFSYQHRENDHHRFAVYLKLGGTRPDEWKCRHAVPALEF